LFCRLSDKNEESFSTVPLEFDINLELSSWRKFTLAATLHSWSPNEVAHCLVSSTPEWEICNLMLKHHHSHQGNPIITIINQDHTCKSRSLPPTEGTNLGKILPSPCLFANKITTALFPLNPSPQSMYIAMVTPIYYEIRQVIANCIVHFCVSQLLHVLKEYGRKKNCCISSSMA
jgi:hypothetical protein